MRQHRRFGAACAVAALTACLSCAGCSGAEDDGGFDPAAVTACATSVVWATDLGLADESTRLSLTVDQWLKPTSGPSTLLVTTDVPQSTVAEWRRTDAEHQRILVIIGRVEPTYPVVVAGPETDDYLRDFRPDALCRFRSLGGG